MDNDNNTQGWIKLHRKILDNPVVTRDTAVFSVWVTLLLLATHSERTVLFKGRSTTLKSGQVIIGRSWIKNKLKLTDSRTQRILKFLEIEQLIEQQTSPKNRIITILNWDKYQQSEQVGEQRANNKRTTSEQQANTNNNVKKEKNVKNEKNVNTRKSTAALRSLSLEDIEVLRNKYLTINFDLVLAEFQDYVQLHPRKYSNYKLALNNWCRRAESKLPPHEQINLLPDDKKIPWLYDEDGETGMVAIRDVREKIKQGKAVYNRVKNWYERTNRIYKK